MPESVLLNYVYAQPVGHAVEALQYSLGYRAAGPDRRIGLFLNADTPAELADWCPFIDEVYTISLNLFDPDIDVRDQLKAIPSHWDHVLHEPRLDMVQQRELFPGLVTYYDQARDYFTGRHGWVTVQPPSYLPKQPLRLEIPVPELPPAAGPRFVVLPGGSSQRHRYPTVTSWTSILSALADRFPNAEFRVQAKLANDGRTRTTYSRDELHRLVESVPGARLDLDLPLREQLAMVRDSQVFLSPHTGFGMAALAAGTPWLCLSGNSWPEYYFNTGVPFYSVLPDLARFPCYTAFGPDPDPVDDEGPRAPSMSAARVRADLAELVDGAEALVTGRLDFDAAVADHFARVSRMWGGSAAGVYSVDDAHLPHIGR